MAGENVKIQVRISRHVRDTVMPLKYGKRLLEITGCVKGEHPRGKKGTDRSRLAGTLYINDEAYVRGAEFVLGARGENETQELITIRKEHDKNAHRLTKIIEAFSANDESNDFTDYIIKTLCPMYENNEFLRPETLISVLVRDGKADASEIDKYREIEQEDDNDQRDAEQRSKEYPNYGGDSISSANPEKLKAAWVGERTNKRGETVRCTFLEFENPELPLRIMDEWADPDGSMSEKAEKLVGKYVVTTVWKPEIYDPLKWWRTIEGVQNSRKNFGERFPDHDFLSKPPEREE
jgi:hypothetical protein